MPALRRGDRRISAASRRQFRAIPHAAALGIAAIAGGFQGRALRRANAIERGMLVVAGVALVYPGAVADLVGLALIAALLALQYFGGRRASPA